MERRLATAVVAGLAVFFAICAVGQQPLPAQSSSGFAEYFVPADETDIFTTYDRIPNAGITPPGTVISRVSIVSSANDVNIFLDEWEDGYDFDPLDPTGTADAKWDVSAVDVGGNEQGPALTRGQVLTLTESDLFDPLSTGVNAGDRIFVSGAPVAMVRTVWPNVAGTESYIAGSWEMYPTVAWQSDYVVPVGENIDSTITQIGRAAPGGAGFDPFEYTDLFITASEDNTRILVDEPGGGVELDTVINRGESVRYEAVDYGTTVRGEDSTNPAVGRPIQAVIMTSANGTYDMRFFTLTPTQFLNNEYYVPVPSLRATGAGQDDYAANTVVETGVYIYSFDPANTIFVETATGSQSVTLGTGQIARFGMPATPGNGQLSGPYAARIRTQDRTKKCWVMIAGDDNGATLDWGTQCLALEYLSTEIFMPFAPANPVYLTPVNNNTQFLVDFDADGLADDAFTLNRFDFRMVYDPDQNLAGARITANDLFQAFWGQDHTQSSPGEPLPDYDFGYTVLPLFWNTPQLSIDHTVSPTTLPETGGSAVWTIVITAGSSTVYNVDGRVVLPPGWEYVPGSTTITFSDGWPTVTGAPADPSGGVGPTLQWLLDYDLAAGETITISYTASTQTGLYVGGVNESIADATGSSLPNELDDNNFYFNPSDPATVYIDPGSELVITKTSDAGGLTAAGDTITYTITVTNVGSVAETNIEVTDPLPASTAYVASSTVVTAPWNVAAYQFRDTFATQVLNGNAGANNWTSSWVEFGENDGVAAGRVQVLNTDTYPTGALRSYYVEMIGGGTGQRGIQRFANLTGTTNAWLTFDCRRNGMEASDRMDVQASDDGGATWTTVASISGAATDPSWLPFAVDMSAYCSSQFGVRFLLGGSFTNANDIIRIDNVSLLAASDLEDYADDFNPVAYTGSDGSIAWAANPWVESDDANVTSGDVEVRDGAETDPYTLKLYDNNRNVYRPANLTGADVVFLTYSFRRENMQTAAAEYIVTEVSSDGGTNWTELARFTGAADDAAYFFGGHDVTAFATANFRVRFRSTNSNQTGTEGMHFDNVRIAGFDTASAPTIPGGTPPVLVPASLGIDLDPAETMTITYQVTVDNPVAPGVVDVTNIVSVTSDQTPTPLQAQVTDVLETCVAIPSASPTDGRFLSIASNDLNTLANERISFYLAALSGTPSIEFSIFDGDTGRGPAGPTDWINGNWDYRSDQLVYRLYADPSKNGSTSNLVGQWLGNDANATSGSGSGSTWISDGAIMPNNGWWNCTFTTSATGQAGSGNYFYRLDIEFQNPASTESWSNFKLRTNGYSISTASNQILAFSSPIHTLQDFYLQYPNNNGLGDPGTPNYDGLWRFYVAEANPITEFVVWNGDFDYGDWQGTTTDSDDANTPNTVPGFATSPATLAEGAKGMGNPADNYNVGWRRIGGNIGLAVQVPGGATYTDPNASGNGEWERFVLRTTSNGTEDQVAPTLGAGAYQIRITDLDIHNLTFLYFGNEMLTCPTTPLNRVASGAAGRVFLDVNGDGVYNGRDSVLVGATVTLTGTTGLGEAVTRTTRTTSDGRYGFVLEPGTYALEVSYALPSAVTSGPRSSTVLAGAASRSGRLTATRSVRLGLDDWREGTDLALNVSGSIRVPRDPLSAVEGDGGDARR